MENKEIKTIEPNKVKVFITENVDKIKKNIKQKNVLITAAICAITTTAIITIKNIMNNKNKGE